MSLDAKTLKICSCNRTMSVDAAALASALKTAAPIEVHSELCRKDAAAFAAALGGDECVVGCTQEAALFGELAQQANSAAKIKFVNIREAAGWSAEARHATPKIAALLAAAEVPEPEPVPGVEYRSSGQLLIIGPASAALAWAERLAGDLPVSALLTDGDRGKSNAGPRGTDGAELPIERRYPLWSGKPQSVTGFLGDFEVAWEQSNPIDLEVCTRCNACVQACPEQAIDYTYQIDLEKCRSHRQCVAACGSIGAIDFDRQGRARSDRFDLVLDLSAEPLIKAAQKPQGYAAPGRDPLDQALAARELAKLVGEFEKPKYFAYDERICAHGRSGKIGCTNCLDVCSTAAISHAGDKVKVEPHLCLGCGGCATVCPSGAMTHVYPRVSDLGARLKRVLGVYREAGGKDAAILFHNGGDARALIQRLGRRGKGLPARVIPLEVHHIASVGMDVALGALAYGASQVLVLSCGTEADEYGQAIEREFGYAQTIANALGYAGTHFKLLRADGVSALESQLWGLAPATGVARAATFNLSNEKRTTLDFAFDQLVRTAPAATREIALAKGAPFGAITVNKETCTLCKACIGACPAAALVDSAEAPRLRFIERNCVQCGLCETTCPEKAIALVPRLLLAPQAKEPVTLNEAQPFHCIRCGNAFGTKQMIGGMMARLTTHSMFAGAGALRRLQMCADCRVIDMMENKDEVTIDKVKR
jgi:ferredoxin